MPSIKSPAQVLLHGDPVSRHLVAKTSLQPSFLQARLETDSRNCCENKESGFPCHQPPAAYSTPRPPPRTDQDVKRVSRTAKIAYIPTPMTATSSSAANTSGTLKLELAISITLPMPLLPAMISAITVPTNDKVIAIFSEAKK